jgi:hypothetical protein
LTKTDYTTTNRNDSRLKNDENNVVKKMATYLKKKAFFLGTPCIVHEWQTYFGSRADHLLSKFQKKKKN